MRPPRVAAGLTLIVTLALVAFPAPMGSRSPSETRTVDSTAFHAVRIEAPSSGSATALNTIDGEDLPGDVLESDSVLLEPAPSAATGSRPATPQTAVKAQLSSNWRYDPDVSWYGPGFYGQRAACGYTLTQSLRGVAHRTLPCGTLVSFRNPSTGATITVPVVDRGPYVSGRYWDLTGGACAAIGVCRTGPIYWRFP